MRIKVQTHSCEVILNLQSIVGTLLVKVLFSHDNPRKDIDTYGVNAYNDTGEIRFRLKMNSRY